jgi:beta-mannosidase
LPVDAATLAHSHVDPVFEGLDTFADVYVNDNAVLHTDNIVPALERAGKSIAKARQQQSRHHLSFSCDQDAPLRLSCFPIFCPPSQP